MNANQYYKKHLKMRRYKIVETCRKAGTTFENFRNIATNQGSCSKHLARALAEASGYEMSTMDILFQNEAPERIK